jgi:phosphoglycolate phosphatase
VKGYPLVIFDFDGTLVDTAPDIAHYANGVLADHGFAPRGIEDVKRAIGKGVHELLKGLAPALGDDSEKLEQAVATFRSRYAENPVLSTKPYPHVVRMLEVALRGAKKAIATNKPQEITERILKILSLDRHFDLVIGMGSPFPPKPDPASLRHIVDRMGAKKGETVLVGDSAVDAEAARRADVDFVWMEYGYDRSPGADPAVKNRFSSASKWAFLAP